MKNNMSFKQFNKIKKIQIYMYLFLSIFIFEFGFCNPSFTINFLKANIDFSLFVFSFARLFLYLIAIITFYFLSKPIIKERYELYKTKLNYKNNCLVLLLIPILTIILLIIVFLFFNLTLISLSLVSLIILWVMFIILFFGKNYIINLLMLCSIMFIYSISTDIIHPVDEKIHIVSAYNISQLNFNFQDPIYDENFANLPGWGNFNLAHNYNKHYEPNQYSVLEKMKTVENELERQEMMPSEGNKFSYIPAGIGMAVAQLLDGTVLDVFYFGRIFNAIFVLIGIYFIFKIFPYKKYCFTVLLTIPYFLLTSSSYSVDGIGMTFVLLFVSYILKLKYEKKELTIREILLLFLLFIPILFFKSASYFLILGLIFLLPFKKLWKKYKWWILIIFALILIICAFKIIPKDISAASDNRGGNTNTLAQLKFLLQPFNMFRVYGLHILNTICSINFFTQLNATFFYTTHSGYLTLIYLFIASYISFSDDEYILEGKSKFLMILISLMTFIFTSTALYLSFTEVGNLVIKGYQARYVWPVIPLVLMTFANKKIKINKSEKFELNIYTVLIFINVVYLYLDIFTRIINYVE